MKKNKQRLWHDPGNGIYGDCYRTCIACLLDLEPEEVPHFMDGLKSSEEWTGAARKTREWLMERGYALIAFPMPGDNLRQAMKCMSVWNRDIYYLLCGKSGTGVNHNVVCLNDEIAWDPSLNGSGIIGPCVEDGLYWIETLIPVQVTASAA